MGSLSKSSLALVGIGTGIGALVALITESSPVLKSMFKLLSSGIMLIFRPIGDFIGFILRPLVIMFMTQVAIPFFKTAYPIMKALGTDIGNKLAAFFSNPAKAIGEAVAGINWISLLGGIFSFPDINLGEIGSVITAGAQAAWAKIVDFFEYVNETISGGIGKAWSSIVTFFEFVGASIAGGIGVAWENLTNFFNQVWANVSEILFKSWNILMHFWVAVKAGISLVLSKAWDNLVAWFNIVTIQLNVLRPAWQGLVSWLVAVWSDVTGVLTSTWIGIFDFFMTIFAGLKSIVDSIANFNPFSSSSSSSSGGGSSGQISQAAHNRIKRGIHGAVGGIITEPIVGFGQRTGTEYTFGEGGPETVVPGLQGYGQDTGMSIGPFIMTINKTADAYEVIRIVKTEMQKLYNRRSII